MANAPSEMLPFLDENAVRDVLRLDALIPAMERALIDYSAGRYKQPDRQLLEVQPHGGYFAAMPAVGEAVGVKLVTFYPGNVDLGLPTHLAMILLFRPETGQPLAVMDGRLITEMRTSAVSAAVADKVAAKDARVLAVLGTGVQGQTHVEALSAVRRFDEIRIWGRTEENAKRLAEKVGGRAMSAEDAVRGADIVVTATSAKEPVLQGDWLDPGAFVAAVGWNGNEGRELDDAAMRNVVIVESRQGTANESGNIRGSGAQIFAEAGEVLAGDKSIEPGATVIFDSVGMAAEDVAAASLVWSAWNR